MKDTFWIERWEQGQIGFHQDRINSYLTSHWPKINAQKNTRVLVPLCGKSLDMLWLQQQGHDVLGVELSPLAAEAFFAENKLGCKKSGKGKFQSYQGGGIEILCGNFFDLKTSDVADIRAVYDRASLIALPPDMRQQYATHLSKLLATDANVLLVTMEYPQSEMDGPPFSVAESEVRGLYDAAFVVDVVGEFNVLENNPRFKERGLSLMVEKSFHLRRRG